MKWYKEFLNTAWKEESLLRRNFGEAISERIVQEFIFTQLVTSEQCETGIRFNCVGNQKAFFDVIQLMVSEQPLYQEVLSEIYRLREPQFCEIVVEMMTLFQELNSVPQKQAFSRGELFRSFIESGYRKKRTVYATTTNLNKLIKKIVDTKKVKTIYDPTVGAGCLLTEVANGNTEVVLYGQDISHESLVLCKMQFILEGKIEQLSNLKQGNVLVAPGMVEGNRLKKFDCIISNPPFGLKEWGYEEIIKGDVYNVYRRGMPSRTQGDYAFISHVVESLNAQGIAVLVEAAGVLFRMGAEQRIRQQLIEEGLVDCVISFPNNTMYGTALPINLLILRGEKKFDDILFIDVAAKVEPNRIITLIPDAIGEEIAEVFANRTEIPNFSRRVEIEEVRANDYNLSIQRYLFEEKKREIIDRKELQEEIQRILDELEKIQSYLNTRLGPK